MSGHLTRTLNQVQGLDQERTVARWIGEAGWRPPPEWCPRNGWLVLVAGRGQEAGHGDWLTQVWEFRSILALISEELRAWIIRAVILVLAGLFLLAGTGMFQEAAGAQDGCGGQGQEDQQCEAVSEHEATWVLCRGHGSMVRGLASHRNRSASRCNRKEVYPILITG